MRAMLREVAAPSHRAFRPMNKKLLFAVLGSSLLQACRPAADAPAAGQDTAAPARPEIRYYEVADA